MIRVKESQTKEFPLTQSSQSQWSESDKVGGSQRGTPSSRCPVPPCRPLTRPPSHATTRPRAPLRSLSRYHMKTFHIIAVVGLVASAAAAKKVDPAPTQAPTKADPNNPEIVRTGDVPTCIVINGHTRVNCESAAAAPLALRSRGTAAPPHRPPPRQDRAAPHLLCQPARASRSRPLPPPPPACRPQTRPSSTSPSSARRRPVSASARSTPRTTTAAARRSRARMASSPSTPATAPLPA